MLYNIVFVYLYYNWFLKFYMFIAAKSSSSSVHSENKLFDGEENFVTFLKKKKGTPQVIYAVKKYS